MPSIQEMIRQELQAAKRYLHVGMTEFAMEEIEHAIMLLGIIHKKERGPMTESEGAAWYRKMATEGEDEFSRKIFARIAKDEEAHIAFFEEHGEDLLRGRIQPNSSKK